jgi:UPF0042 nucleotide-binding protein
MSQAATTAPAAAPPAAHRTRRSLVLVTGLSGAGRSTALRALEDMGYEAVDNLPLALLAAPEGLDRPLAIGIDSRTRGFSVEAVLARVKRLSREPGLEVKLVYLTCADETLQRRFTETRRRHPLAQDRPVADGIRQEHLLLDPLRANTDLAIGDLKRLIGAHFALDRRPGLAVTVMSFAYRFGLPREADLVFDTRFLANPHYRDEFRARTGQDPAVGAYIEADPAYGRFFTGLTALLLPLIPGFEREGKSYLTLAVGCTGGRHRSVFVAERLAAWLTGQGRSVELRHRDIAHDGDA